MYFLPSFYFLRFLSFFFLILSIAYNHNAIRYNVHFQTFFANSGAHESITDKKVDMREHTTQRYIGKVACFASVSPFYSEVIYHCFSNDHQIS